MKIFACAVFVAAALAARPGRASGPDPGQPAEWATDASSRRMRVAFDPGRRAFLGVRHAPGVGDGGAVFAERMGFEAGLSLRHAVDFADEGVRWKLEHDFVRASVGVGEPDTTVFGELYALRFLRWSADGSVVLPTAPPRRLGFPFGVGFEAGVGKVDLHAGATQGEIGVVRGSLLLDLVPRRALGSYVTLGVGPRYDLRVDGGGEQRVEHVVVPFSQPELALHLESSSGHHVFGARGGGGYAWTSAHGAGAQAGARLNYEAIVLAVNDLPVAVGAEVRWRWDDPTLPGRGAHEVVGLYGLRLGIPIDASR